MIKKLRPELSGALFKILEMDKAEENFKKAGAERGNLAPQKK